jgi:tritrans,polycis-undecaprenyl-diphosphate synthase [geranylgeranyl-diphosphate specific]
MESKQIQHIGIILDGNRRFSKKLMKEPWKGHEYGAKKVEKLFDWCRELNIREITLYAFSIENFNRPKKEFDFLMNIFRKEFKKLLNDPRIYNNKIKIKFIGRIQMLPEDLQEVFKEIEKKTKDHDQYKVNFAIAYGGRAELIDTTKKIAQKVKEGKLDINEINEDLFMQNLYLSSEPDLIIRTSGEQRTSGFLIWQGSYSELYFCKKFWPEFEKEDLIQAIEDFKSRQRRFGK